MPDDTSLKTEIERQREHERDIEKLKETLKKTSKEEDNPIGKAKEEESSNTENKG